jgi:hypothetical protein
MMKLKVIGFNLFVCFCGICTFAQTNHFITSGYSVRPFYYDKHKIERGEYYIPFLNYLIQKPRFGLELYFSYTEVFYQKKHAKRVEIPYTLLNRTTYLTGFSLHRRIVTKERWTLDLLAGMSMKSSDQQIYVRRPNYFETLLDNCPEFGNIGINLGGNVKFFMSKRFYASYTARHASFFYTKCQSHILSNELGLGIKLGKHE